MPIIIEGPHGLGDNIYQRAVLNVLVEQSGFPIYVRTPWPELLPARALAIRSGTKLRTQAKHERAIAESIWRARPFAERIFRTSYGPASLVTGSILGTMAKAVGVHSVRMDLPVFPAWAASRRPIAVIRPVTVRTEWSNPARNPDPEALQQLSCRMRDTHHVVVVADIDGVAERLVGPMPEGDEFYVRGELSMPTLFGLCAAADILVGGVGWLVPLALATRQRALILFGGHGGHNAPERILGPLAPADHRIRFVYPTNFCRCTDMRHACQKTIDPRAIDEAWEAFA